MRHDDAGQPDPANPVIASLFHAVRHVWAFSVPSVSRWLFFHHRGTEATESFVVRLRREADLVHMRTAVLRSLRFFCWPVGSSVCTEATFRGTGLSLSPRSAGSTQKRFRSN